MAPVIPCTCDAPSPSVSLLFFFTDPATTEISTLSIHDALPIWNGHERPARIRRDRHRRSGRAHRLALDRKSTRLNSSHLGNPYTLFCSKKKAETLRAPIAVPGGAPVLHHVQAVTAR